MCVQCRCCPFVCSFVSVFEYMRPAVLPPGVMAVGVVQIDDQVLSVAGKQTALPPPFHAAVCVDLVDGYK